MFTQFTPTDTIKFDTNPQKSKHLKAHSANPEESKTYWQKRYYGDNFEKIMKEKRIAESELRRDFFKKYPSADQKKFSFEVLYESDGKLFSKTVWYLVEKDGSNRFNITGDGFKSNPLFRQFLHWPRGWRTNGTVPGIIPSSKHLNLNKILVFVTETEHFNVALTPVNTSLRTEPVDIRLASFDYINNPWYTRLAGSYVCGYLCGISLEHLDNLFPRSKSHIITAIVRYHFVLWIRRFLAKPDLLGKYLSEDIKKNIIKHIPVTEKWDTKYSGSQAKLSIFRTQMAAEGKIIRNARLEAHGNMGCSTRYEEFIYRHAKNNIQDMLMPVSNGLTKLGSEMFQESMESYIYCVLGAQARTRWCITGSGAKSFQTQEVFRKLFMDQVVLVDTTSEIADMRTAIKNTNIRLDFAVSPGMILCSSDLRLSTEIRGYNNVLTVASKFMSFGGNTGINNVPKQEEERSSTTPLRKVSFKPPKRVPLSINTVVPPYQQKKNQTKKSFAGTMKTPLRTESTGDFISGIPEPTTPRSKSPNSLEFPILFSTVAASTWLIGKLILNLI